MGNYTIQRIPDAPIILAILDGSVTVEDVAALSEGFIPYFDAIGYEGFLIIDLTHTTVSFTQIFQILRWQKNERSNFVNVRVYVVGSNSFVRLYTDLRSKDATNKSKFSIFLMLEDALAAAYANISLNTDSPPVKADIYKRS